MPTHEEVADEQATNRALDIINGYSEWTYWGQHANFAAAQVAAKEIACAVKLGRPLTADEVGKAESMHKEMFPELYI